MKDKIIINILISLLFVFLTIAGIISYKSIDWNVLKVMEQKKLVLPEPISPIPTSTISATATPSSLQK